MPTGMMYSVVFFFLTCPSSVIRPETFNITALWGSMGHCVMLMAVDSVPRLWGRKGEERGLTTKRATSMRGRRAVESGELRVAAVGMGRGYCLTRLRPASMRRKMNNRIVKPHSDEPP